VYDTENLGIGLGRVRVETQVARKMGEELLWNKGRGRQTSGGALSGIATSKKPLLHPKGHKSMNV
jgi:hypothetical protein